MCVCVCVFVCVCVCVCECVNHIKTINFIKGEKEVGMCCNYYTNTFIKTLNQGSVGCGTGLDRHSINTPYS